jgi:hypothetical protein
VVTVSGPNTLRISEILSDPEEPGRDGPYEWVELVNAGAEPVSTSAWQLGDASRKDALPDATVPPGGYIVVAGSQAKLPGAISIIRVPDGQIGSGVNNDGDALTLVAPDGSEVDAVSCGDDVSIFDPPPPAPEAGETLGVRTAGADPDASNWAITLRPTPGEPNLFPAPKQVGSEGAESSEDADNGAEARVEVKKSGKGGSPLPWILLGGAATAGGMVVITRSGDRAANLWRKVRRGR